MELQVSEIKALEPIKFNYEELKTQIATKLENYKNIVYTEENIKEAKADRANLNKLAKALNDEKIRIKNIVLKPYEPFEKQCNELIDLVKETSTCVDVQVKNFEQQAKDEKLKQILNFFIENVGEYKELIDFDTIYNEKWLNVTYKMDQIEKDIMHILSKTKTDLGVIDTQFTDESINKAVKMEYFKNIANSSVLTNAILKGNEIIDKNKKLEELKQKEESLQNVAKKEEIITNNIQNITKSEQKEIENEKLQQLDFRVHVTPKQKLALRDFLKENNIKFEPVPQSNNKKEKMLVLDYDEGMDTYGDYVRSQSLENKHENIYFGVCNLDECPEDAIIGRDLFTADDYVSALNKGIELSEKGYTAVIIREVENKEEK